PFLTIVGFLRSRLGEHSPFLQILISFRVLSDDARREQSELKIISTLSTFATHHSDILNNGIQHVEFAVGKLGDDQAALRMLFDLPLNTLLAISAAKLADISVLSRLFPCLVFDNINEVSDNSLS